MPNPPKPPSKNWNMTITNQPFPLSKLFRDAMKSTAGTLSAILMTIAFMMMSDSVVQNIIRERENNIKHQIIVSGASKAAYWMGHYLADIIFQAIPSLFAVIGIHVFGLNVPGVELLFAVMVFASPAFLYFYSFLFEKDDAGSLAIKMLYFLIGVVAPITISILDIVNADTKAAGQIMRWFFYPFPIFSLSYGYISISQKDVMAQIESHSLTPKTPASYSLDIAGPALISLLVAIPFYWGLLILIEMGFCSRKKGTGRDDLIDMH